MKNKRAEMPITTIKNAKSIQIQTLLLLSSQLFKQPLQPFWQQNSQQPQAQAAQQSESTSSQQPFLRK